MPTATAEPPAAELLRAIEEFFAGNPRATVREDGSIVFDMASAHYSLTAENGRCLLHLWSDERNFVRTVCGLRVRKDSLRVETRRFGQTRPLVLEIAPGGDRRSPSSREAARAKYQRFLERTLARAFPDWTVESLRTAFDLEHSFGPAYTRGVQRRGLSHWALIAVNDEEPQSTVDGVLTLGILWLAQCREQGSGKRLFEGLRVVAPAGRSATVRARMAWLHAAAAKWELYELDERADELHQVEAVSGNLEVKLAHAFDPLPALERCRSGVESVLALLSQGMRTACEVRANSATEVSVALHGLEFARVRYGFAGNSFARTQEVTFGAGARETPLNAETEDLFRELTARLFENRHAGGTRSNPLYRLQPERWLESLLRREMDTVEPSLRADIVYTQAPAFSSGDRGLLDLLMVTRTGRLAVIEVKADDDLHLPLQALDYWSRVRQLQRERAFQRHGYFRGIELSELPPLLYLVAPALRIHPATDTVLRYLSPEIPWEVIGLNEDWRKRRKVILRKRSESTVQGIEFTPVQG